MGDEDLAAALARLRQAKARIEKNDEVLKVVDSKDEVLARFRPLLQPNSIPSLTEDSIRPFFYFENNKHWSGLFRQVNRVCADMNKLRGVLTVLVDESRPVEERLDSIAGQIRGLGKAILTALLLVAYPDRYGVWNNTSDGGLMSIGLMPDFPHGTSFGNRYALINDVLNRLAQQLDIDLWTLDALWWSILPEQEGEVPVEGALNDSTVTAAEVAARFALERHLHDFLFDNWDATRLGEEWQIYARTGEPEAGYEFVCGVGKIDILAKHKTQPKWLIVELKRSQSSDAVVGQTLRYMGWVKKHLAEPGDKVEGLIIALGGDPRLHYAVDAVSDLSFMSYQVDFKLLDAPAPETWAKP